VTEPEKPRHVKYIVIGDGFAGRMVGKCLLQDSLLLIKPESSQFSWSAVDKGPFEKNGPSLFGAQGGGMNLWGGALSKPSLVNFFNLPGETLWHGVYEALKGFYLKDFFVSSRYLTARSAIKTRESRAINLFLKGRFRSETHGWARSWTGQVMGTRGVKNAVKGSIHSYRIISIRKVESGRTEINVIDGKGKSVTYQCDVVVFAAGAFINAYLVSLLTAQISFPLGNHYSEDCVILKFSRRIRLRPLVQAVHLFQQGFLTWRENLQIDDATVHHHSYRLVSTRRHHKRKVNELPFFLRLRFQLMSLVQLLEESMGYYRQAIVQVWVEAAPSRHHKFEIFIDSADHVCFAVASSDAQAHLNHGANRAVAFGYCVSEAIRDCLENVSCSVWPIESFSTRAERLICDRLHYFGTVPVASGSVVATIDKNLQLRGHPGVFVLGSSAFTRGSDAHPTLLIILLASRLGKYLQSQSYQMSRASEPP
jgi:hypothetical protein